MRIEVPQSKKRNHTPVKKERPKRAERGKPEGVFGPHLPGKRPSGEAGERRTTSRKQNCGTLRGQEGPQRRAT